jgi:hypothetical protein
MSNADIAPCNLVYAFRKILHSPWRWKQLPIYHIWQREYGRSDPLCWPRDTLYQQKLVLTSPTSGGHSVRIVRSRTKATDIVLYLPYLPDYTSRHVTVATQNSRVRCHWLSASWHIWPLSEGTDENHERLPGCFGAENPEFESGVLTTEPHVQKVVAKVAWEAKKNEGKKHSQECQRRNVIHFVKQHNVASCNGVQTFSLMDRPWPHMNAPYLPLALITADSSRAQLAHFGFAMST